MKRTFLLASLAALMLGSGMAQSATQTFKCGFTHYVRNGGAELVTASITVRNHDPAYAATILQLTIRDSDGNVVHDSGPATASPLPLNTDFPTTFPQGKDITVVPALGAVYLRSNHIWGNNGLPVILGGNETGQLLSAWVVVSKEGPKSAVAVQSTQRFRTRVINATTGAVQETDTRSSSSGACEATP